MRALVVCALGIAGCAGCALGSVGPQQPVAVEVAEPTEKSAPPPPTLICRWVRQINADGLSIVQGNPKDKTLDDLAAGALVYDSATQGRVQCRKLGTDDENESGDKPTKPHDPDAPIEL